MSVAERERPLGRGTTYLLVAGDVLAIVLFVVLGFRSHHIQVHYLANLIRVATPLLAGWFIVSVFTGAYRPTAVLGEFMKRSALTWIGGILLGLLIRGLVLREGFIFTFMLVTLAVTGVLLLGWRLVYFLIISGRSPSR